jgi:hypothetical protein
MERTLRKKQSFFCDDCKNAKVPKVKVVMPNITAPNPKCKEKVFYIFSMKS